MTFVAEFFVKCFELYGTHSLALILSSAALRASPINPKENKKKNGKKKEKRKPLFQVVKPWDVKVFGKNTTYCKSLSLLIKGYIGGDFLQNAF